MIWAWRSVEADFQRYYGIDLLKELATMTYRRFLVLVNKLPADSSTAVFMEHRTAYSLAEGR